MVYRESLNPLGVSQLSINNEPLLSDILMSLPFAKTACMLQKFFLARGQPWHSSLQSLHNLSQCSSTPTCSCQLHTTRTPLQT